MKLSAITTEPKLIELLIDDEDTVKEFGEPLSFHTWDRQPMSIFVQLANLSQGDTNSKNIDIGQMLGIVKCLILDENGKELITEQTTLPTHVLLKVIEKVSSLLGK